MANNEQGLVVPVGADVGPLKTGLAEGAAAVKQFTQGTNEALAQTQAAMGGAAAAADKTKNSTKSLGETLRETGSKGDLTKSLVLLQGALNGTTGAFDATKAVLITFAGSLGGPALVAVTAMIAAIGSLAYGLHNASEAQKQLNADAAALNLNINDVRNMTGAMKDFATQLVAVHLGFGKLNEAQLDIFKSYGIDPKSAEAAQQLIIKISNTVTDEQTKIKTYAIATGQSYDEARKKWEENHKEMEKSADGFWTRMMKMQAAASLSEAGNYAEAVRIQKEALETKGDRLGLNENSTVNPAFGSKTQDQIDDERKLQDQLFDLRATAAAARVGVMQDEVAKIREQAKLETQALLHEKEVQLRDVTDPGQRQQIGAAYDQTIAAKQAAAERNARQVAHQAALDEEKAFRSQMAALSKANDDATAAASTTAGDKIRNAAQQQINALRKMLDDYFASPEFQKLSAADQASKKGTLNDQFNATAGNITATSTANARKADLDQQVQQQREFQDALNALTAAGEGERISAITNSTDRIIALGDQRILALNEQYEKDLENLRKNVQDKDQLEEQSAQLRAARDEAESQIRIATAKKAADEITAPMTRLMENWGNSQKNLSELWASGMNGMVDNLTKASMGMKTEWKSLVRDMVMGFIRIQIAKAAAGIFGAIGGFGGGTAMAGGTSLSGATIGMAAGGGNIDGPTWVGERGPEIFDPAAGRIIPNGAAAAMTGGAQSVEVTIVNKGTDQKVTSSSASQTPNGLVVSIFTDDIQRGGPMSNAMSQAFGLKRGGR